MWGEAGGNLIVSAVCVTARSEERRDFGSHLQSRISAERADRWLPRLKNAPVSMFPASRRRAAEFAKAERIGRALVERSHTILQPCALRYQQVDSLAQRQITPALSYNGAGYTIGFAWVMAERAGHLLEYTPIDLRQTAESTAS